MSWFYSFLTDHEVFRFTNFIFIFFSIKGDLWNPLPLFIMIQGLCTFALFFRESTITIERISNFARIGDFAKVANQISQFYLGELLLQYLKSTLPITLIFILYYIFIYVLYQIFISLLNYNNKN